MNIGLFILMYIICTFITIIIGFFVIRFLVKKDCHIVSKIAQKQINDYFNSYDSDDLDEIFNSSSLDENININDDNVDSSNNVNF